ncbi:PDR/VanB family oxidoreductase (plasmid) [Mycolicibacterium psychrotolerans]|uniref:PDR/VanB family oxidoreductase n=1 Tax=Mycolicibacterium psychrotolerans TaxID=216929 RepID=UPI003D67EC71
MLARDLELVVKRVDLVAKRVVRLTLARDDGADLPIWEPGAHIDLHFVCRGVDYVRQYSLCGNTTDRHQWEVAVLLVPDGRGGSIYVHEEVSEGDRIGASLPRNNFPLISAQHYLFIAGGIGITPLLPMIAAVAGTGADWRLTYCGRSVDTMAFTERVCAFGADRVSFWANDTHGVADLASIIAQSNPNTVVYSCGPESMLRTVEESCASLPARRLRTERFARRAVDLVQTGDTFEVEFALSGVRVTVPADRTILDVAAEAGIDIDVSCQEGVCGSCEMRVISGTPDHRDEVLSAQERAAGRTMMVCVSRSRSARLVLDL